MEPAVLVRVYLHVRLFKKLNKIKLLYYIDPDKISEKYISKFINKQLKKF
jgi:hypothetical protein